MRCPFCAHEDSQVKDSRPSEDGAAIRRRRQCEACGAALHHLRAGAAARPDGRQEGRQARAVRPRQARPRDRPCDRKRDIDADKIDRLISGVQRQLETQGDEVTSTGSARR